MQKNGLLLMAAAFLAPSITEAWITTTSLPIITAARRQRGVQPLRALQAQPMMIQGVAAAGVSQEELQTLEQAFVFACQDLEVEYSLDKTKLLPQAVATSIIPGSTGRVLLLQHDNIDDEEVLEDVQASISNEIDQLLYADPPLLSQPILLSMMEEEKANDDDDYYSKYMNEVVQRTVDTYEMAIPLPQRATAAEECPKPSMRIEVDGAMVTSSDGEEQFWDTSTTLVYDDIITDDLRQRLLDVVLGREEFDEDWDDAENGPDPRRWVRGGLMDVPADDGEEEEVKPCWGLVDDAIDDLCLHQDAFQEFETIVADLFPDFTVSRLPEAVLGGTVSPLTANAPTHGDDFAYHIDADPYLTPPSPWTDVYGRYPNRQRGKPRFVSCLVYLNDEWKKEWGAPTRFLDVATDTHYDVEPRPGRCVVMDQDVTHSVVAPTEAAGKRPRYSLVWKLILHPKETNQDMVLVQQGDDDDDEPDPILVGSAQNGE